MRKHSFILMLATVASMGSAYAQYTGDALRFSQTNYGSTSRFKAMGNAQIGVGGDMSSLGGNPAGLGLFTKSEFSFTPEFNQSGTKGIYLGQNNQADKGQLNVNQIGVVFFNPVYKAKGQNTKSGFISTVFGLGYNRTSDLSMESNFGGLNKTSSIADYFAEIAGSITPNNLTEYSLERMAYNNYLISYDEDTKSYYPETFADANNANTQLRNEIKRGSVSEFNFSAAANISNKVYIGANIGLVNINYTSDAQFTESGLAREYLDDNLTGKNINYKLMFNQNQDTKGSGVNGRIGVIVRATDDLRLGATLQTPSWFVIEDNYTEQLDNRGTIRGTSGSKIYPFTYNLRTPLKGSFGASYIINGQALITGDIDFIDYASTHFSSSNGGDLSVIADNNATVRQNFTSAVNYRAGIEYKINSLSLRTGYAVNGSPYKSDKNGFFDTKIYSGGLGYRASNYFVDLTYQKIENQSTLSPYTLSNGSEATANLSHSKDNVFLTFGLRF